MLARFASWIEDNARVTYATDGVDLDAWRCCDREAKGAVSQLRGPVADLLGDLAQGNPGLGQPTPLPGSDRLLHVHDGQPALL